MNYTLKNGQEVSIRGVNVYDAKKMVEYMKQIALETNNLLREPEEVTLTVEQEEKFVENLLKSSHQYMFSVWANEELISLAGFHGSDLNRIKHRVSLGISILTKYRNQGLGTKLMHLMCEKAKEMGKTKIELDVRKDNPAAIRSYEKAGFVVEGYRKDGINDKGQLVDLVLMGKNL